MAQSSKTTDFDREIRAISAVHAALKPLPSESQGRVVKYVCEMLGLNNTKLNTSGVEDLTETNSDSEQKTNANSEDTSSQSINVDRDEVDDDELEGISPIARKWMRRNDLTANALSRIFSLGVDEIDFVAKSVPGKKTVEKMRNVFLLKGLAGYLGGGVARFTHKQVKEACLHYDAYDSSNFSRHVKAMSSEISGTKEAGYQLTPRGLTNATDLVRQLLHASKESA